MERTIFLQHYRVCTGYDGTPNELGRDGAVTVYEAVDERSGDPVAMTLVPIESIDPSLREQFEDQAGAVQRLRHVNIAKVFDLDAKAEITSTFPSEWQAKHLPRGLRSTDRCQPTPLCAWR